MTDVLLIAVTLGFFALATLLVKACDVLIGDDLEVLEGSGARGSTSASDAEAPTDPDADATTDTAELVS